MMRLLSPVSIYFLLLLIASPLCTMAQNDSILYLSLQQAIDYALKNRPDIILGELNERIADNQIDITKTVLLPQINGVLDARANIILQTTFVPNFFIPGSNERIPVRIGTTYNFVAAVELNQALFDASFSSGLKYAKTNLKLQSKRTSLTTENAKVEVYQSYYTFLLNKEKLELSKKNMERNKKNYDDARVKYENQTILKSDLDRLFLDYSNAQTIYQRDVYALKLSGEDFERVIGYTENASIELTDKLKDELNKDTISINYEVLQHTSFAENRPDYQVQKIQDDMNQLMIKRVRNDYYPKMNLYGYAAEQVFSNSITVRKWFPVAYVGAKVTFPIFDAFVRKNNLDELRLLGQTNLTSLKQIRQNADYEVKSAWITMKNSIDNLKIWEENIRIAEEVIRINQIRFEENSITSLELATSEATLKETQTNYMIALYNYLIAKVSFKKAKGEL